MRHYCDLKGGNWWFALFLWCSCVSYYSETLSFIYLFFYEEKRLVFLSQNTSFRSHWPTLKTSRDINSNETREENDINRRIFSVRITLLRVSFLFIHLCVHLESVKDGQFSGIFSCFFCSFWEKCKSLAAANFHI